MSHSSPETSPAAAPPRRGRAVVITPAPAGGLGDQAMIDVAARELSDLGFSVTLMPNPTPVRTSVTQRRGDGMAAQLGLLWELMRAKRVIVIGADILDGSYSTRIMLRLRLAQIARHFGARVRVIGSSFSPKPNRDVVAFLKSASWLEVLARERISQVRMQTHLERAIPLVADSAFLLRPEITCPEAKATVAFAQDQKAQGRRVLALNVSGLVFTKIASGALDHFAAAVAQWVANHPDVAPVILAHDRRAGKIGDIESCDILNEAVMAVAPDRTFYLRDGISAWDVKALAAHLDMAFLCRMHLAIACLGQGVPPLALVSMGKFEGLMDHFGLDGLTLDPATAATDPATLHAALDRLAKDTNALRTQIETALPNVRAMSVENYTGL